MENENMDCKYPLECFATYDKDDRMRILKKLFNGVLVYGLVSFSTTTLASFEKQKDALMASCMKVENNISLCSCSVSNLDKGVVKKMLTSKKTSQLVRDNILSDMAQDWNAHIVPLNQKKEMSDLEGARFAISMNNWHECENSNQTMSDVKNDIHPIQEEVQNKQKTYDLEAIVGKQILKTDLKLNGQPFTTTEIKLKTFHSKDGAKKKLGFTMVIPKHKLPQDHPDNEYYFDIIIGDKKIGRTSSWYSFNKIDAKITHAFTDAELDRLFSLAPLSGKKIKLTNGYIDIEGIMIKK